MSQYSRISVYPSVSSFGFVVVEVSDAVSLVSSTSWNVTVTVLISSIVSSNGFVVEDTDPDHLRKFHPAAGFADSSTIVPEV